jgi:hypothetical protein
MEDVRTSERKIKNLVSKVYHFFRSSKIADPAEDDVRKAQPHGFSLN